MHSNNTTPLNPKTDNLSKVKFPSSKEVLFKGFEMVYEYNKKPKSELKDARIKLLQQIEFIKQIVKSYNDNSINNLVSLQNTLSTVNQEKIDEIIAMLKERWKANNQFFTIFDASQSREIYIDPKITELLGLQPNQFNSGNALAVDEKLTIYHRDEIYHSMRFALVAYIVITSPIFDCQSERDYYVVKFKISTKNSANPKFKKLEYIPVEKKCYLYLDPSSENKTSPNYHFDVYTILPEQEHDYVYRSFGSEGMQSINLNLIAFLANMHLLDISPKYLLLLDEKQHTDRYKNVSNKIEENIHKATGLHHTITEHQVADYFSKSIRSRVAEVFNEWDQRKNGNKIEITSDIEAIERTKQLGLLPLNPKVRELMYSMIR
jgi:uncharacterized protein (DUF2249 family)